MNDNKIVSIGGKVLSDAEAQEIAAKRVPPAALQPAPPEDPVESHKEACLKMLRHARNLVENDQMDGVIIIGRQKGGVHFFTDLALDRQVIPPQDMFSFVGVLDVLKRELGDIATMAPFMIEDGSIVDPFAEPEEESAQ